ncbi:hypothetical protein [Geodermatophilus sabuli]|uniref:Uncharacterized protein n=1 Tax=Geodermatophilus sabuli TaxID=1564158 RepID=A0A285E843_9ACTN|nr:hypothetical protein [Geodermatophilus sabuli]MBB3082008.1 hypothetical protein [Geodermatophilus sabuli]SNX95120.1 hypothetical protein SAMN06893097_101923 [Geodermatophilus sabuli]
MASSPSRSRAAPRRSPRPAPRPVPGRAAGTTALDRPLLAPFAAVFGVLVAAEDLVLGYLLWEPDRHWHWYVVGAVLLAAWAAAGAAMVWLGRGRGWLVLAGASVLPLLLLLGLLVLFGVLGGGSAMVWAVVLLIGPVGCLTLAVRRPIREWTRPARATRSPQRDRRRAASR